MKIIVLLSFYDESPSWLSTVVAGVGQFADAVVACDGGYMLYPGARPRSMPEQVDAIRMTAEAVNLECVVHQPKDIWRQGEVEKRNQTVRLAGAIADPDIDWLVVMDADMHMMKCNSPVVRWELENTKKNVATMTVLEGKDMLADDTLAQIAQNMDLDYEWTTKARLIYRYHPSLAYGPMHWSISRKVGRRKGWLWGPTEQVQLEDCLDLGASLVCYHRSEYRAYLRRQAAHAYYELRDARKIEQKLLVP